MSRTLAALFKSLIVLLLLQGCTEQKPGAIIEMAPDALFLKLQESEMLMPFETEQFSEAGKHKIIKKQKDKFVTYAYEFGTEQYRYAAYIAPEGADKSRLEVKFMPSPSIKDLPKASQSMLFAAAAERIQSHLQGRPLDGSRVFKSTMAYIVLNPAETASDISAEAAAALKEYRESGLLK